MFIRCERQKTLWRQVDLFSKKIKGSSQEVYKRQESNVNDDKIDKQKMIMVSPFLCHFLCYLWGSKSEWQQQKQNPFRSWVWSCTISSHRYCCDKSIGAVKLLHVYNIVYYIVTIGIGICAIRQKKRRWLRNHRFEQQQSGVQRAIGFVAFRWFYFSHFHRNRRH